MVFFVRDVFLEEIPHVEADGWSQGSEEFDSVYGPSYVQESVEV